MKRRAALALLLAPAAAHAQDGTRFCPNNPSLESSACTTEPGRVHVEVTALDWTLDKGDDGRDDTLLFGTTLARIGVGPATELQVAWTPLGHDRRRDEASGTIDRVTRAGDATLAVRQNLRNPDGKGLSYGLQPFVTLPVGRRPVGSGTWGAGLVVPVTYDLTDTVNVGTTGEIDAAPDEDGHGRHAAASGVAAVSIDLDDAITTTLETELLRDDDPAGATTQWLGGLGLAWKVAPLRTLYAEAIAGLNHDAPDVRLYAGFAVLL